MASADTTATTTPNLPSLGYSRWKQIAPFLPVSRERWRQLGEAGKAPKRIRLGERCTVYSNSEVHRWLADPLGYQVT